MADCCTFLDIVPVDDDVVVAIHSRDFVVEAQRVHELVLNVAQLFQTASGQRDLLLSALPTNCRETSIISDQARVQQFVRSTDKGTFSGRNFGLTWIIISTRSTVVKSVLLCVEPFEDGA